MKPGKNNRKYKFIFPLVTAAAVTAGSFSAVTAAEVQGPVAPSTGSATTNQSEPAPNTNATASDQAEPAPNTNATASDQRNRLRAPHLPIRLLMDRAHYLRHPTLLKAVYLDRLLL